LVEEKNEKEKDVEVSDINLQSIDTKSYTDLNLSKTSHEEILKNIKELHELLIYQCLPSKNYYSESTQTDDCNILSSLSPKKCPPPLNFISVLKCKNRLQLARQNDFNSCKPIENLNINEYSISNHLSNDKISNINNVKSSIQNVIDYDNKEHLPNINNKEQENDCSTNNNNNCDEIKYTQSKDKLFTKLESTITKENVKQVLKNINSDFEFLTKDIHEDTNKLYNNCMYLKFGENNFTKTSTGVSNEHNITLQLDICHYIYIYIF